MARKPYFPGSNFVGGNWQNGFGVTFELTDEGQMIAHYTFAENQQGPPSIAHGGAIAALLDEAMTAAAFEASKGAAFTVTMNINYKSPVYLGTRVTIQANIERVEGRKIFTQSQIMLPDDTIAADATGLFINMNDKAKHDEQ